MKLTETVKVKKKRVITTMIMRTKVVVVVVVTMMIMTMMKLMRVPESQLVCIDNDKVVEDYINEWT
jgi:flagellar basal body-associated protein FliL